MRKQHSIRRTPAEGFTLLEVVISMLILALLAGSVYAIVSSAIGAARTAMEQQLVVRRLDAFLRVSREAFLNLPATGTLTLEIGRTQTGDTEQRLIFSNPQGVFGVPSLAGGSLVLAAKPHTDGTRTMTLLKIPANASVKGREEAMAASGIPLLPKLRKPRWSFKTSVANSDWKDELPASSPRPSLVRLQMQVDELPDSIETVFYVPPLGSPPTGTNSAVTTPSPGSSPSPAPPSGK